MRFHTVWAMFFSPTGTTRRVCLHMAKRVAKLSSVPAKTYDFTLPPARQNAPSFTPEELVFFGVPVYAGRVPNLLVEYIRRVEGGGAGAVPLVLYGNRAFDDALMELGLLLEEGGFRTMAGCAFIGEHSFGRSLAGNRPDREDMALADRFAEAIHKQLARRAENAPHHPVPLPGSNPPAPYFRPKDAEGNFIDIRRVKPETAASCIACGLCASRCPMGSIDPEDPSRVTGICIKCNACVKGCPVGAKHFADPNYLFHSKDILRRYETPRKNPMLFQ